MTAKDWIVDPSLYDIDKPTAGLDEIRRFNMQRFEIEQLDGILHEDTVRNACVGLKIVRPDEFWVKGHMPGFPLMPGVLLCEAAAQVASYFAVKYDLLGARILGFGGMEDIRFRGMVAPGDKLVIQLELTKVRRGRMVVCRFNEWVGEDMVCEGIIKGVPIIPPPGSSLETRVSE